MRTIVAYLNNMIMKVLPETRCFGFKRWLWRRAGVKVGRNVRICSSVSFYGAGTLEIGDNTWVGNHVLIVSSSSIKIGASVDIAPRVFIGTGSHTIDVNADHIAATDISKDVTIGDGCWICINATILPGVTLGKKCVVAAGSVVTKSFTEDKILIAGVPAKKIKSYVN